MMTRHPHCDGKLHFNVYRMDKLLACGVDGTLYIAYCIITVCDNSVVCVCFLLYWTTW